ncbi:MAG: hypothetical protein AAF827_16100 [Cyanobacteria bacterium P01_D01_bin.6]
MSIASPLSTSAHPNRFETYLAWLQRPLAIAALGTSLLVSTLTAAAPPAAANTPQNALPDGVYALGESPTAGQLGTTYMVIEVSADTITGGFYQPASSFDCFYGEVAGNEMALTVIDSYAQTEHPFALALGEPAAVASQNTVDSQWIPNGFYLLPELSTTDYEVLQVCGL